jgi:hypothetical protein
LLVHLLLQFFAEAQCVGASELRVVVAVFVFVDTNRQDVRDGLSAQRLGAGHLQDGVRALAWLAMRAGFTGEVGSKNLFPNCGTL